MCYVDNHYTFNVEHCFHTEAPVVLPASALSIAAKSISPLINRHTVACGAEVGRGAVVAGICSVLVVVRVRHMAKRHLAKFVVSFSGVHSRRECEIHTCANSEALLHLRT